MQNSIEQIAGDNHIVEGGWAEKAEINPTTFSLIKNGHQEPTEAQKRAITDALNRLRKGEFTIENVFPTNGEPTNEPSPIREE